MTWRLTFSEGSTVPATAAQMPTIFTPEGFLKENELLVAPQRMELRGPPSQIIRMSGGSELTLLQTQLGMRLEYYKEMAIFRKTNNCGKYRTSCYFMTFPGDEEADFMVRPGVAPNTDEVWAVTGNLAVTEFDDENRAFGIVFVDEGQKLILQYDMNQPPRDRYTVVSLTPLSSTDYQYFMNTYQDPQDWTL